MINILIIITGGFIKNGIVNNSMNYYKNFQKKEIHIDYLCNFVKNPKEEWLQILKENNSSLYVIPNRKSKPLTYIKKLRKLIKQGNYDIVHAMGSSSILSLEMYAAYKENVKVRIAHSRNTTCDYKILNQLLKRPFNKYTNVRFACGKQAGEWLFGNEKFDIINNGNDTKKFIYKNLTAIQYDNSIINIVSLGLVNSQKNYIFMLKVCELLKKRSVRFKYRILGEKNSDLYLELDKFLKNKGLENNIEFLGSVDNPQDYLSASDIFVLPSLYEGFPNVLIEAQMNGIPCIVSNTITDQACLCDNVYRIGISGNDIPKWVDTILSIDKNIDRVSQSEKNIRLLREEGYDIVENAKWLENKYIELVNKGEIK